MMPSDVFDPPYDKFLETAAAVTRERSDVDPAMAREVFEEVATLLYNGLALDGLDEHDTAAVVDGLCVDLIAKTPVLPCERARMRSWRTSVICMTHRQCHGPI